MTNTVDWTSKERLEIFSKVAPDYWSKNIPVIPLRPLDKRPIHTDWSKWCREMPTVEEQEAWLKQYVGNNIGMPCGEQSGIIVIDYDYDNPKVEKAILSVTGESPWVRVGQRGCVRAYRYNTNIPGKKQIADNNGKMVVEILSNGSQVVLPPSIHPKTQQPYQENCRLVDVLDQLPMLPDDLEDQLRLAIGQVIDLSHKKIGGSRFRGLDVVPSGSRDIQMTRHAGLCAREVLAGNIGVAKALDDMTAWFDSKVEKVVGDDIDVSKGHRKILEFLINDVTTKNKILPPGWDVDVTQEQKEAWGLNFDAAHEEWTLQQCNEYIDAQNVHAPSSTQRMDAIQFILRKLARSTKLDVMSVEAIIKRLSSDTPYSVASLKKQLKQLKQGPIEGLSHTEIAKEMIKEMEQKHGQMAYWNSKIWCWEGSHWGEIKEQLLRNYVQMHFGELAMSKKFSDHKQIVNVVKDLLPQQLKAAVNVDGVNFANGFLNRDGKLLAHNPEFGMIYTLPFSYKPELAGKCPKFLTYLQESWGMEPDYNEKIMALQEAMSSTFYGTATTFQRCFLLRGVANSGKSVLNSIISAIVPDEARSAIAPEMWGEPYMAAQFARVVLNVCGETHETKKIDGKRFKEIVDGSEITSRDIYESPFKFRSKAAHWFASNHLPKTNDTSEGFNRRWLIFYFSTAVPPERINVQLANEIIYEEIEAIVAWALEGYPRLLKNNGYTIPASHWTQMDEMTCANSTVRGWMKGHVRFDGVSKEMTDNEVYRMFWAYCSGKMQTHILTEQNFHSQFGSFCAERGWPCVIEKDGMRSYKGLAVISALK